MEYAPGGLSSMDELLNMPFDQLWSRTTRTTRTSRRTVEGGPYTMPIPEIDYEALLALGRPQMVHRESAPLVNDQEVYQELVQLDDSRVRRGVRREALLRLPDHRVKKNQHFQCQICMESLSGSVCAKKLPCKHVFCKRCIDQWLADHDTCPTCRWKFPEDQTHLVNLSE